MPSSSEVATIGDNRPPPEAAFGLHIDDLFSLLSDTLAGGEVSTDEQEAAIDAVLDDFRQAAKDADKARTAEKKPHDDAAKAVQAKWKPIVDKAERGAVACKEALTPYRTAKQQAKDEAARKAREEAEAREADARKALKQSDDLEAKFAAEQELEAASKLKAVANKIDRSATGLRTYWEAEITDRKAALLHYLGRVPERFEALIQQMADEDARSTRAPVPGIIFHERKRAA
jgi:chemotaxis protein histidine kinase CheA